MTQVWIAQVWEVKDGTGHTLGFTVGRLYSWQKQLFVKEELLFILQLCTPKCTGCKRELRLLLGL